MRQRPLVIGHRAEIAPINPTAARFTREKCPASSVGRMPRSKSLRAAPSGKIRRTRQSARRRCADASLATDRTKPRLGRSQLAGTAERKWQPVFADRQILERNPNVKTNPGFCVLLCGPVFSFSSERTPWDSSGAAGVYARRFPLLSKAIGRRCVGSTVLATEPAKTKFCLSKGIPEPRPVVGIAAEANVNHLNRA
jgi:hypothetical protein